MTAHTTEATPERPRAAKVHRAKCLSARNPNDPHTAVCNRRREHRGTHRDAAGNRWSKR